MKKMARIISVLLTASMMLASVCACKTPVEEEKSPLDSMTDKEKAQYLSEKSDEYYAERMKTSSEAEMKISGNLSGVSLESTTSMKQNSAYDKSDSENVSYVMSSEVHSESTAGGITQTEDYEVTESYSDDYYVYSYVSDDSSKNVYQYCVCFLKTFENYLEEREYFSLSVDENEDFETVSVTKDEKLNLYILKYSEPSIPLMKKVNRYIALTESGLVYDADLRSFTVEITVNAETLAITSRTCNMTAKTLRNDSYDLTYELKIEETFAKNAKLDVLPENLEQDYVKNDNLILRQMTLLEMRKLAVSEDVSFDITSGIVNRYYDSLSIGSSDKYQTVNVHYGKRDGKFMYRMTDSSSTEILYNGSNTFVLDGEKVISRTFTPEFNARSLIYATTVQPFMFDEYMIRRTKVEYDGLYAVCMMINAEYSGEFLSRLGIAENAPVQFVAFFKSVNNRYELVSLRLEAHIGQKNYYDYTYQFVELRNISTADLQKAEEIE